MERIAKKMIQFWKNQKEINQALSVIEKANDDKILRYWLAKKSKGLFTKTDQ